MYGTYNVLQNVDAERVLDGGLDDFVIAIEILCGCFEVELVFRKTTLDKHVFTFKYES